MEASLSSGRANFLSRARAYIVALAIVVPAFAAVEGPRQPRKIDQIVETLSKKKTVQELSPLLKDSDPMMRAEAVTKTGQVGGKAAARELENVLANDENAGVRMAAAFWLGGLKSPGSAAALGKALETDSDANVRAQAARSLQWLKTGEAKSQLQKGRNDKDSRVRRIVNER